MLINQSKAGQSFYLDSKPSESHLYFFKIISTDTATHALLTSKYCSLLSVLFMFFSWLTQHGTRRSQINDWLGISDEEEE